MVLYFRLQLLCVVHMAFTNTYGSLVGFVVSAFLRLAGGEPLFQMQALIWYPWAEDIGEKTSSSNGRQYGIFILNIIIFFIIIHTRIVADTDDDYYCVCYVSEGQVYQKFPFKTFAMLMGLFSIIIVSALTNWLFRSRCLPANLDVFECVVKNKKGKEEYVKDEKLEHHESNTDKESQFNNTSF